MIQPPTDNLYKFLAILGLVVFGFSWYVPLQRLEEHNREVAKWNAAWGPIIGRAQELDDSARAELDCVIARARGTAARKSTSKDCSEVESKSAQSKLAARDLARAMEELRSGKEMLDYLGKQFVIYRNLGIVFGTGGLLSCVVGFWLWYVRLQKPLDLANRNARSSTSPRSRTET